MQTRPRKRKPAPRGPGHHGLDRLVEIHRVLQSGQEPTVRELVELLGCSSSTIQRSLRYLKEERGHPIEYNIKTKRYSYTGDVATLPDMTVTEDEVFTLFFATKILAQFEGTPMHAQLTKTLRKLTGQLKDDLTFSLTAMESSLSVINIGQAHVDALQFQVIQHAIRDGEELGFDYLKAMGLPLEQRQIQPWKLACVNGQWYLFGMDRLRNDLRTFAITRISQLKKLGKYFKPIRDFDLNGHLSGSFGVYTGKENYAIHLRFSASVAHRISERQWHPRQQLNPLPTGELDFHLHLNSLNEILSWILYWGRHCKVIAPECLKEMVREEVKGMGG